MAFTDAIFDGTAKLDGVFACRIDALDFIPELASGRLFIPVVAGMFETALAAAPWFVLVDARIRKRAIPDCQRGLTPLTIGLGPSFVAGETVDVAIETTCGEQLGSIIENGPASPSKAVIRQAR